MLSAPANALSIDIDPPTCIFAHEIKMCEKFTELKVHRKLRPLEINKNCFF